MTLDQVGQKTATTDEHVDAINRMVLDDRRLTVQQIRPWGLVLEIPSRNITSAIKIKLGSMMTVGELFLRSRKLLTSGEEIDLI